MFGAKIEAIKLVDGLFDLHSHLLPGVDDGSRTGDETRDVLGLLAAYGLRGSYFTPHIMADMHQGNNPKSIRLNFSKWAGKGVPAEKFSWQASGSPQAVAAGIPVRYAAEYMMDEHFSGQIEQGLLTFDGRHVLVEMRTGYAAEVYDRMILLAQQAGYAPILAHPERYLTLKADELARLRGNGVKAHLNILSLTGRYGELVLQSARDFLRAGLYDFLVTDIHGQRHIPAFTEGYVDKADVLLTEPLKVNNAALFAGTLL